MPKDHVDELSDLISEAKRVAETLGWSATASFLNLAAIEASKEADPLRTSNILEQLPIRFPRRKRP
jgi:hypothetical protein